MRVQKDLTTDYNLSTAIIHITNVKCICHPGQRSLSDLIFVFLLGNGGLTILFQLHRVCKFYWRR
jgi:hypothetical protein